MGLYTNDNIWNHYGSSYRDVLKVAEMASQALQSGADKATIAEISKLQAGFGSKNK